MGALLPAAKYIEDASAKSTMTSKVNKALKSVRNVSINQRVNLVILFSLFILRPWSKAPINVEGSDGSKENGEEEGNR